MKVKKTVPIISCVDYSIPFFICQPHLTCFAMFIHVSFQKTTRFLPFRVSRNVCCRQTAGVVAKDTFLNFLRFMLIRHRRRRQNPLITSLIIPKFRGVVNTIFAYDEIFDEKSADFFKTAFRRHSFCHYILLNISGLICIVKTVCHQLLIAKTSSRRTVINICLPAASGSRSAAYRINIA